MDIGDVENRGRYDQHPHCTCWCVAPEALCSPHCSWPGNFSRHPSWQVRHLHPACLQLVRKKITWKWRKQLLGPQE